MGGFLKEIFREPSIVERYLCMICALVFRDAVQSPCGHRYCETCIKEKIKTESSSERRCPVCPENSSDGILFIDEIYPDFVVRKEIRNAAVKCINEGCNWTGKLQEYSQEHEASCPFERIKCLKSGCGKTVKRGDLSYHLERECPMRMTDCRHCKKQLPFKENKKHIAECPEMPVACPNCNKRVSRSQLDKHIDPDSGDCAKRKTKCMFHPLGCNAKVVASGMQEHLAKNDLEHNQMMINALNPNNLVSGIGGKEGIAQQLSKAAAEPGKASGYAGPELSGLLGGSILFAQYPGERQSGHGKEGALVLAKALEKIPELEKEIKMIENDLKGKFTKMNKDFDEKIERKDAMIAVLDHRTETFQQVLAVLSNELEAVHFKATALEKQNTYLKEFTEKQEKRLYSQDQMLTLKNIALAEQELRIQALEAAWYDGVLLWRISDIKRRRQDAVSGKTTSFYSPVFYTSRHGYKLSARIYLNGDGLGKRTHMSMFFVVMRGAHDALLPWPFQQKVTFMLLDQKNRDHIVDAFRPDPASSSFKRPTGDMNIASGCPLFVTQELLDSCDNYIRDDTMFLKVIVDTTGLEKL